MSDNVTKKADEKFCSSCGAIINIATEICPKCGVRQMAAPHSKNTNASKKGKTSLLIWSIVSGVGAVFGFYFDKTYRSGIVCLIAAITSFVSWLKSLNQDSDE